MRSRLGGLAACVVAAVFASAASDGAKAQYPERPIRLLVPFPAGGGADVVARLYSARLEKKLGQPIVVENVTGAAGVLAAQRVAAAPADGYTLLIGGNAELLIRTLVQPTSYDPLRDFTPISLLGAGPMVVVGRSNAPAATLADVIEMARAKPGAMSFGSGAQGTPMHLIGEAIKARAGVDIRFVPYRGAPPTLTDLVAGHIDLGIVTLAAALTLIDGGKVQPLAVTSLKRTELAPTVPTVAETKGLSGLYLEFWAGLFGPANMPGPVRDKLAALSAEVLGESDLKESLAKRAAFSASQITGKAFEAFIAADYENAKQLIADARVSLPK